MVDHDTIVAFEKAAEMGIHRTVHAGEAGPALMVWKVLQLINIQKHLNGTHVILFILF